MQLLGTSVIVLFTRRRHVVSMTLSLVHSASSSTTVSFGAHATGCVSCLLLLDSRFLGTVHRIYFFVNANFSTSSYY